jgi:uncharacterized protein Yka (UPF0111/DUF47 family)
MPNAFDRAERWRQRAVELRAVADRMSDHKAQSLLQAIAAALDGHARKIEEMALKIRRVHHAADAPKARRRRE